MAGLSRRGYRAWVRGGLALGGALSLAAASLGCTNPLGLGPEPCDRSLEGNPPLRYSEGLAAEGVYTSSDWSGEWLSFPGGMHYALEHHLGAAPAWVQPYLSFHEQGLGQGVSVENGQNGQGGTGSEGDGDTSETTDSTTSAPAGLVTPAAGDVVSILGIDDRYIVLANMTCASYYLRVVAGLRPAP